MIPLPPIPPEHRGFSRQTPVRIDVVRPAVIDRNRQLLAAIERLALISLGTSPADGLSKNRACARK